MSTETLPTDQGVDYEGACWYEEYKTCSCSFIARTKSELPGYCPRHGNSKRRRQRIPDQGYKQEEFGYAG